MSASPSISENVKTLAKNLTKMPPCSPRKTLAGYIIAARMLEKCRAELNDSIGEYRCLKNSGLDERFLTFTGIDADEFKALVATGATDVEVAEWIKAHSKMTNPEDVAQWNNELRTLPLNKLPINVQVMIEDFIAQQIPPKTPVRVYLDKLDIEEGHIPS